MPESGARSVVLWEEWYGMGMGKGGSGGKTYFSCSSEVDAKDVPVTSWVLPEEGV